MSDHLIRVIPADPSFLPSPDYRRRAQALLQSFMPQAQEVEIFAYDAVRFVDQGDFFERVNCPKCGQELDTAWWQEAMDIAYADQFRDLPVSTPCWAFATSLNELDSHMPAGFSEFLLEAREPNMQEIKKEQIEELEAIVGCRLRQIWAKC
jgi:hypothetical protein